MGKHILVQRAGRGNINFRSPSWIKLQPARLPPNDYMGTLTVKKLVHEPGRGAPLALAYSDDMKQRFALIAVEGIGVGSKINIGAEGELKAGDVAMLEKIPDGEKICFVELRPGDGGRLVKASGEYATVSGHGTNSVSIILPSKKTKALSSSCRAMIGVVAGGGRAMAPMLKAGVAFHKNKRKAKKWPGVRGVAMNPVSHPHGGGGHQSVSHPSTVARNTPAGRKVGHVAARRTGIRKR